MEAPFAKMPLATKKQNNEKSTLMNIPGLTYQEIPGDGHCLYHAVAIHVGREQSYLRQIVAAHLEANIGAFREFIDLPAGQTIESFLQSIRAENEWAAHIEIEVLMRVLNRPILVILQAGTLYNQEDITRFSGEPIFVCYNGHNHYDAFLREEGVLAQSILNNLAAKNIAPREQHSLPTAYPYIYAPKVRQTDLTIDMDERTILPEALSDLIQRLTIKDLQAHDRGEMTVFNKLLNESPSIVVARPIQSKPSLEKQAVKINIAGPKIPHIWNVPTQNNNFVDRFVNELNLLNEMRNYFENNKDHQVLTALHGLGGIGKTQLALAYVWKYHNAYSNIYWFNADSNERLVAEYITFGQENRLFTSEDSNLSVEQKAKRVKRWFENNDTKKWLLVLDNPIKHDDIADILPINGGHILITSRHTEWPGKCFAINLFSFDEAKSYAQKIIGIDKVERENVSLSKLITELESLPLALAQAYAYIKRSNKSIAGYLELYKKSKAELLAKNLLITSHKHDPVLITWNITLKQMREESPESVELLYYCLHLCHQAIPIEIVKYFFEKADEIVTDDALRIAKEYSMITIDETNKVFSLHNLVQYSISILLAREDKDCEYLVKSINALDWLYPNISDRMEDFKLKRNLIVHFEKTYKMMHIFINKIAILNDEDAKKFSIELEKSILLRLTLYLADAYHASGDSPKEKAFLKNALKIQEIYYKDHPPILAETLDNLASVYEKLGKAHRQKMLAQQALAIQETHYGKEHIELINTLNNLASASGSLGDIHTKKSLLQRAIKIEEAHYGKAYHERSTTTKANLGNVYLALGEPDKAKVIFEKLLKAEEQYYGVDHIKTTDTLNNLSIVYDNLGDFERVIVLLEKALRINESFYGKDHVRNSTIMNNLACTYGHFGFTQKKKALLERTLNIEEKYYGKGHINIAKILTNLGISYGALGDAFKQKVLLSQALNIVENYYGEDHVEVTNVLNDLANAYGDLGDVRKKIELLERALKIDENFYGRNHIKTSMISVNLACAYGDLGDSQKKKNILENALHINKNYYGNNHIVVAKILVNLADAYGDLGDVLKKKELLETALPIKEKYYGTDHVEVARVMINLCHVYEYEGDPGKIKILCKRILPILKYHYGHDHIEVGKVLNNLGAAYGMLNELKKSKDCLERTVKIFESCYGKEHIGIVEPLVCLGATYSKLECILDAKQVLERALNIQELFYKNDHTSMARTLSNLSICYKSLGDFKQQKILLERALKIEEEFYPKNNIEIAKTLVILSGAYEELESFSEEKNVLERSLGIFEEHYGKSHSEVARLLVLLGRNSLHFSRDYLNQAKSYAARAYYIFLKNPDFGKDHSHTEEARQLLGEIIEMQLKFNNMDNVHQSVFRGIFNQLGSNNNNAKLQALLSKYKLNDASEVSIGKGLRMAANNNQPEDLVVFLTNISDINTQDTGNHRKTALHWAVIKNAKSCVEILLEKRAKIDIPDVSGKTAYDYATEKNDSEMMALFTFHQRKMPVKP